MELSEAVKIYQECKCYGQLCELCPLRISKYFVHDAITGVKFGVKVSVCNLFCLAKYLIKQNEEDPKNDIKLAQFFHLRGEKANGENGHR